MTIRETTEFLRQHDNFLIITHRRPDGDTIGSSAALCRGLRQVGKQAAILENPQTTSRYKPYLAELTVEKAPEGAVLVAVDIATENLFPLNGGGLKGCVDLCIDHHGSNEFYAKASNVHPECAACGELMYRVLGDLCGTIGKEIAEDLYLAVSTDTGCFQYSNVTADTLRIAAELKELGADTYPINKVMFGTKSIARLRLEAALTESVAFYAGGLVGVCVLTKQMMQDVGATEDDADDIAGFPRGIEGVEIGVMIREQEGGGGKISLRTGQSYDASAILKGLGGGGHPAAAGAAVGGSVQLAKEKVLSEIAAAGVAL